MNSYSSTLRFFLTRWLPVIALAFAAAAAMAQTDPPARIATLSQIEGSVAFAPAGETEWGEATINRPITRGDRLWTDPGGRAELHLGSAALYMASQTFVEVVALDDEVLQLSLNEGAVNARVRQLEGGENFEVTTPQLTFRAAQPGDYRIDADPVRGYTRVTVRSGAAMVYGAGGGLLQLRAGQQMAFTGRDLAQVAVAAPVEDSFDRWAIDRNRAEDQSISARYVPREVVGYQQLDAHGVWSQDPGYGPVWYPTITASDWAPYRYGRWEWIVPWGWTWIDDARWGFAPFHYGRWAQIGSRWAWVPGRIGPRPVYSPALVVFAGGGPNWNLSVGSGPGIAWFPLAPGEAWRPTYRASNRYLRNVNRDATFDGRDRRDGGFHFQRRSDAITAVRIDDFNRGRPVHQHWNRVNAGELGRVQIDSQPILPEPRRWGDTGRAAQVRPQPRMQSPAPAMTTRPSQFQAPDAERREPGDRTRPAFRQQGESPWQPRAREPQGRPPPMQQAFPAPQVQIERERTRRDQQEQLMQQQRAQQAQQVERGRQDREQQAQREQASRHHQAQQIQQRQRDDALRQQPAIQQQERMQRQQQAAEERVQRQQWQQRTPPQQQQQQQQALPAPVGAPTREPRGESRERGQEPGWRGQQREERADQREDDRGRGRAQRIN